MVRTPLGREEEQQGGVGAAHGVDVDAEGTPLVGEEAEPRRKGSGAAVAMLVFALLLTVVGAWYSKEILEFVDAVCKDMKALRQDYGDGLVVALISGAMFLESLLPIPLIGVTLLASGIVLGFPLGFLAVYPASVLGATFCFLLARSCCLSSATALITARPKLKAIADAIQVRAPLPLPAASAALCT